MKKSLAVFALGAIALLGIPGCSSDASNSSAPTTESDVRASLTVGSSSSTASILAILEEAYISGTEAGPIDRLEPAQSETMILGAKQGLVDVAFISRAPKPEEDDGTLAFRVVARDALLVGTHPSVTGVKNLTTEQLKAIYSGSATNWKQLGGPDAAIVVLDRPEDESAKRLLRKHYLGPDLKSASNAIVLRKEGELIQSVQSVPYSIGAFSLAYAISHNLSVNRLSLDGIEPTVENLKAGRYPMARTIGLVWQKNASDPARSFVAYIFSQPAVDVMERAGFAPVAQTVETQAK